MQQTKFLALPVAAAAFSVVFGAQAQTGAAQPGRIEQEIKAPPEPVKRDIIRIERPRFPEQVPVGAQDARFTLGGVELAGNQAISTQTLSPLWAERVGKVISLSDAFGLAAAISAKYRDAGYILSQAVIPVQDLSTTGPATLRIQVLEGYVDKVSFTGIESSKLQAYLAPVQAERPLRLATLERSLLLVSELAGVSAQANIKAGSAPNASDLEIVVARSPREFSLSAHNRTAPSQGDVRIDAAADFRGVLSDFDRHNIRWVTSGNKRLNLLSYSGEMPLGSSGLKGQLNGSTSKSEPTSTLGNFDTRSDNLSLGLSYPVVRSRQANLALRTALAGFNNSSDTTLGRISEDRIRALRFGVTADYADEVGGISLLDLEASKGLSGLGASKAGDPLLSGASPTFSKLTAYAARLQSLGGEWSLLVALTAQGSSDKLPTAEQLGLGGDTFLRAYDPSEVIGENGLAGKIELRYNTSFAALFSTLYAYLDSGSVRRKQVGAADVNTSLSSAGLGIRVSGPYRTKGYLEIAKPIHKVVTSQGNTDPRAFAGIGIDF